jgi:hypothetical protein
MAIDVSFNRRPSWCKEGMPCLSDRELDYYFEKEGAHKRPEWNQPFEARSIARANQRPQNLPKT